MNNKIGVVVAFILVAQIFLCCNSYFCNKSYAVEFSDVPSDHWAYQYVNDLSNKGIINGYDDGTFKPNGKIKTTEFLKLMVSSAIEHGHQEEFQVYVDKFAGYQEKYGTVMWYDTYFQFAWDNHLIADGIGYNNCTKELTRDKVAFMLRAFSNFLNVDYNKVYSPNSSGENKKSNINFTDIGEVSDSRVASAITFCASAGLITGYDDGTFKPNNTLTRAEVATIVYRFNNLLDSNKK